MGNDLDAEWERAHPSITAGVGSLDDEWERAHGVSDKRGFQMGENGVVGKNSVGDLTPGETFYHQIDAGTNAAAFGIPHLLDRTLGDGDADAALDLVRKENPYSTKAIEGIGTAASFLVGGRLAAATKLPYLARAGAFLADKPLMQLVSGATSGIGEQAAEDNGVNPLIGALVGGSVPSMAGSAAKVAGSVYDAIPLNLLKSNKEIAANKTVKALIEKFGGNTDTIAKEAQVFVDAQAAKPAIQQTAYNNLDRFKPTAEAVTGDSRSALATLAESQKRGAPEIQAEFIKAQEARDAARMNVLNRTRGDAITTEEAGAAIRPILEGNKTVLKEYVTEAAERAKLDSSDLNIWGIKTSIRNTVSKLGGNSGAFKPSGELASAIADFEATTAGLGRNANIPLRDAEVFRSRFGALTQTGSARNKKIAATALAAFDKAEEAAVKSGAMTKDQLKALRQMRAYRKELATTFENDGIGSVLKKRSGEYKVGDAEMFGKATGTVTNAEQLQTAIGASAEGKDLIKRAALTQMEDATVNPSLGRLNDRTFVNYLNRNEGRLSKEIAPSHMKNLKKIADDIASQESAKDVALSPSRGGSSTTQTATLGGAFSQAIGSLGASRMGGAALLFSGHPVLAVLSVTIGKLAEAAKADSKLVADRLMTQYLLNPKVAATFASRPTTSGLNNALSGFAKFTEGVAAKRGVGVLFNEVGDSITSGDNGNDAKGDKPLSTTTSNNGVSDKKGNNDSIPKVVNDVSISQAASDAYDKVIEPPKIISAKRVNGSTGEKDMKVDSSLLKAVAFVESSNNPKAEGPKTKYGTAKGLYQFIDSTGQEISKKLGYEKYDPYDPKQAEELADYYLGSLLDRYKGDEKKALVAYNWGLGNLDKLIKKVAERKGMKAADVGYADLVDLIPAESRNYVSKIYKKKNDLVMV